jgi:hypothetical protein
MLGRRMRFRRTASTAVPRRLLFRAAALAIGATVVLPALAPASLPVTSRAWAADQLVITSDNSGGPLVSGFNLAPGGMPPNCLAISHTGAVAGDELRFFLTADRSSLANYIDVTIEQGHGGRYGNCSGFSGAVVYQGTLAALGLSHGTQLTALLIAPLAPGAGTSSVRLTFAVHDDNRAQGGSTTSDFTWIAGSGFPAGGGTGGGGTGGGTGGGGTPGGGPIDLGTTGGTTHLKVGSTLKVPFVGPPAPAATKPAKPAKGIQSAPSGSGHVGGTSRGKSAFLSALQTLWDALKLLSKPVAEGAALGLGTLPFIILFLLIQDRIDRGDPKLAKAPSYAEPDLGFGDRPTAVFA